MIYKLKLFQFIPIVYNLRIPLIRYMSTRSKRAITSPTVDISAKKPRRTKKDENEPTAPTKKAESSFKLRPKRVSTRKKPIKQIATEIQPNPTGENFNKDITEALSGKFKLYSLIKFIRIGKT